MKDWVRLLDASAEAHTCKLDYKDCKTLADDIRALLREEEAAREESRLRGNAITKANNKIAELKAVFEWVSQGTWTIPEVRKCMEEESKETERKQGQKGGNER